MTGALRPLVLLHGFTGSPESFAGVAPEGARFLAPAALGHGGSPGPARIDAFDDELDRLAARVRAELGGLPRPHLAGYSMGGRLALGLLVRHPDLFHSATLIGASPGLATAAEREERAARDEGWARLLETEGLDTFVAAWESLPLFASQEALPDDVVERQRRIRRSHDPRGLARSLRVLGLAAMPDYRRRLPHVERPVRLVVGERDAKFRALAAEMAALLPRPTIVVVPDAGHNVVIERPGRIAQLLRAALLPEDTA